MLSIAWKLPRRLSRLAAVLCMGLLASQSMAMAQERIDADLVPSYNQPATTTPPPAATPPATTAAPDTTYSVPEPSYVDAAPASPAAPTTTYQKDDVVSAAEGVFGKGAEGLAAMIEKIFKDQGQPNGYIAGREASGAVVFGLRYGSGTLTHKVEGERKVYWTGPSVGFDVGGNASKAFVLVYNLYDTQDLFRRYLQGEGSVYVIGGFTATYLRRGNVVLIPIRMGVGWRLGLNGGYMKFTEKSRIIPF